MLKHKELCDKHGVTRAKKKPRGWFCYLCETENQRNYRQHNPVYHMIMWAKIRSKERNLPFTLTKRDISIPEYCPVLGIPLKPGTRENKDNSPTLDRIIPELGYTKDNVRVISHRANRIKSDASVEELERVLRYIKRETAPQRPLPFEVTV